MERCATSTAYWNAGAKGPYEYIETSAAFDDDGDFDTEGVWSSDMVGFLLVRASNSFYDGARCAKVGLLCAALKQLSAKAD
jgi:hypothetical protein